jgi:transcriptional regulator with XRE-family HTH domain
MSDSETPLDWRQWMRALGVQQRRLRQFLGLSQEELARRAGVSQAAVSRLETGRGLATPLLIVLRIGQALARELRLLDPAILDTKLRGAVEKPDLLPAVHSPAAGPSDDERGAAEVVALYQAMPEKQRRDFLTFLEAAAAALGDEGGAPRAVPARRRRSAG